MKAVLANTVKILRDLRAKLGLQDDNEWRDWIRNKNFKPYWEALWNNWLKHHRAASGRRGLGFEEVINIQKAYMSEFAGYLNADDTEQWEEGHHLAYFLFKVVERNKRHLSVGF